MSAYVTYAEADTFFSTRLENDDWSTYTNAQKSASLQSATDLIDRLDFIGEKTESTQDNEFPRNSNTLVPDDIKYACMHLALRLLDDIDLDIEIENQRVIAEGYSSVRTTYNSETVAEHIRAGIPSIKAWGYLYPYLRSPRGIKVRRTS